MKVYYLLCFPKNKTGSYINFCSKNALGLIFKACFILQSCHLLVAAQWWSVRFHLTGAYFWGRAYITSSLKKHTRAYFQVRSYFQGNRVAARFENTISCPYNQKHFSYTPFLLLILSHIFAITLTLPFL